MLRDIFERRYSGLQAARMLYLDHRTRKAAVVPTISDWDAIHPIVVHFPIALLLVAPLLVLAGILRRNGGRAFQVSALVLMLIGTAGAYGAVATGEAAGERAGRMPGVGAVLESHKELAEATRAIFTALTISFIVIIFAPDLFKITLSRCATVGINAAFLLFYMAGAIVLANAAHQGGRLVHELGVSARAAAKGDGAGVSSAPIPQGEAQVADERDREVNEAGAEDVPLEAFQ
jgi:uncharacterized membrane protein